MGGHELGQGGVAVSVRLFRPGDVGIDMDRVVIGGGAHELQKLAQRLLRGAAL